MVIFCSDSGPPYPLGTLCIHWCNNTKGLFRQSGDESRTCQAGGIWSGNDLVCADHFEDPTVACSARTDPPEDGRGSMFCSNSGPPYKIGTLCIHSCNETDGFIPKSGDESRTCQVGGTWDGDDLVCADINECEEGTDTCDDDATCTNTPGSYTCDCDSGYRGDGNSCTDIDECAEGTDTCDDDATCTNTPGGYTCDCVDGYTGDGFTCTDVNECEEGTHTCHEHATCTNTPGGHTCACRAGYNGDGFTCTGGCSSGFEFWNGACYYYSPGRRTFLSAESDCDRRRAKLVIVPDSATHQYLIQKANGKRFIWIGLSDRRRERAFVWSNDLPLAQSFHPWRGRNNRRANCVSMMKWRRAYVWKVRGCSAKFNYFCQKSE
ncbi:fibrillin-1-like [Branchiostoma lanceolatum]|uniref:fibrillin-1-like n=1 Tax=Branchiostoma lanceolatum TaxID=7740 RepID=UPI003453C556